MLISFFVGSIPAGLLLVGAFWIKESPRWLLSKHRRTEALKNLCWMRNLGPEELYMVEEVAMLDAALEEQAASIGEGFWKPFKAVGRSRTVQWRFILGGLLFMWQNGSGINAINYYSPTVFKAIGISGTNTGFLTTGIFGVIKTALTFVWMFFLIDNLGRRNLLMIGAAGGSVCMWIIGGYISTRNVDQVSDTLSSGGIAAMFFFVSTLGTAALCFRLLTGEQYLWTAFYTPSWNGTPWVINSEIFDMNTRGLGQASAAGKHMISPILVATKSNTCDHSQQLVLELHHISLHTPDVRYDGPQWLRCVLLLCLHDARQHCVRLVPRTRDQIHPTRGHGPSVQDQACTKGEQDHHR